MPLMAIRWWRPRVTREDTGHALADAERNPYLAARSEFQSVFGDLAKGKRNWQLVALALLGLLAFVLAAYVNLASGARVVPYLVQVDKLGQVASVGRADRLAAPEPRLVAAQLAEFIRDVRTVLPALAARAQAELLERGYAFVDQRAAGVLNQYFADPAHDPRVLGAELSREVTVTSVLPIPQSSTWSIRWTETTYPLSPGAVPTTSSWDAYLTVRLVTPTTSDVIDRNPLGIYITAVAWSELAERQGALP